MGDPRRSPDGLVPEIDSDGREPVRVAVLGSTGSIGRQALEVAALHPERIRIVALAAGRGAALVVEQARRFGVSHVALADPEAAGVARGELAGSEVGSGPDAVVALACLPEADVVLNALVGAAGLRTSMAALAAGKRLALANKESLVVGGELVTALAAPGQLVPVDSEHSAIFQCLVGEPIESVARLWITASGGPFRGRTRSDLAGVTREQALAHPRWTMGPKISIDSATLMNKGLEVIEAHHLFDMPYDRISVVIHPQSIVHSMVEFSDGSVKAHLGATDMRIPIQYALTLPERWGSPVAPLDLTKLGTLEFAEPDLAAFPALELAIAAGRTGGTAPAILNAANEVAVAAFLEGGCAFLDIDHTVAATLEAIASEPATSIERVEQADSEARRVARGLLERGGR
jgi:1-deoxy-D-xylulose-5-phosphate reductoisomerase